jgi:DNA invertase Pin-like site-specific DNA recombinase
MTTPGNETAGQGKRKPVYDNYARLSIKIDTGELEKIEDQWADNDKVIERLEGQVGVHLSDGLSAWRKGVRRPGWETLLDRLVKGVSDGVVVWHVDRLIRQPRDLERLIDLADQGYTVAASYTRHDLSDPNDRFILRVETAHSARSSDDTQRRTKRRKDALRRQGIRNSPGRAFGFAGKDRAVAKRDVDNPEQWPQVPDSLVERERDAIREATKDVLAGVSVSQIAVEWNGLEPALLTINGLGWTPRTVKNVLLRGVNAGWIEHEGEVVGHMPGEPIIEPDDFAQLRALFASRRKGRVAGQEHVGSGIVKCGKCGNGLGGSVRKGGSVYDDDTPNRFYRCSIQRRGCGKVHIDGKVVDDELREITVVRLSDDDYAAAITAAWSQVAERVTKLNEVIESREQVQQALTERLGRMEITVKAFDTANKPLMMALEKLYEERQKLTGATLHRPIKAQSKEALAAQWDDGTIPERRAMLVSALGDDREVVVEPTTRKGPRPKDTAPSARVRMREIEK